MSSQPLVRQEGANPFAIAERTEGSVAVEQQRAIQEVQAALVIAQKFPRDENKAIEKIRTACKRQSLAEVAEYEYSRGGTRITGPTVELLKAIASRWGNIAFGWDEIERRNGVSTIMAYAWDQQTNARNQIKFQVRHWRDTKSGGHEVTDERDIYEVIANVAARRMRACMESVIDSDVVDLALEECHKTMKSQSEPLIDRVRRMTAAFSDDFQVSVEMIEKRIGNKIEAISENQLASLRRVYKSMKDGVGKREEFFKNAENPPEDTTAKKSSTKKTDTVAQKEPETVPIKDEPHNPDDDGDLGPQQPPTSANTTDKPEPANRQTVATTTTQEPEPEPEQPYNKLMTLLQRDGVTDEAVMSFMRSKKLAKDSQKSLAELSTAKHVDLVRNWDTAVNDIRKFQKQ